MDSIRPNCVVNDITHRFIDIYFPYMATVVNSANKDKNAQAPAVFSEHNRTFPLMTTKRSQSSLDIHQKTTQQAL